jgi:hypothetical protein
MRRGGMGRGGAMMARRMRRRRRRRRVLLVGGLVAFGAYKMSTKDADKIKEHTGTDPEEMTDEELEKAMKELNIEKQMRDDSDLEAGDIAPAQEGQAAAEQSYMDELERLAKLKDDGIITKEEFETKKQQLLDL